ncbi:MAG: CrcB family protein [Balneolales bacterium]
MVKKTIMVGLGGAIGAMLRYGFILIFPPVEGAFPLTIFAENMVGSFLLGLLVSLAGKRWKPSWPAQSFFGTGLLGSFTTFSNFSMELVALIDGGQSVAALVYVMLSIIAGLASAFAGLAAGSRLGGPS